MQKKMTIDKIKTLFTQRQDYYDNLHKQQKTDDDYYELVFKAGIPANLGYEQRTPPTARDWVDVGVRYFTLDNPRAKVLSRGDSEVARKNDLILQSFYDFWLTLMILMIKESAKKLLLRGEVFFKVGMDDTYFGVDYSGMKEGEREEMEAKRLIHFPLLAKIPDPINVYCSPAHNGIIPLDVIESFPMTISEAEELCERNNWSVKWKQNKKSTDLVQWMSYISADWRAFLIGSEGDTGSLQAVLKPEVQPNILKFCPYVHIPAGYGTASYQGKPEYLYRSIIFGKRDMLRSESRILSQIDAINARYAWERVKITGPEEAVRALYGMAELKLNPNDIIRETDEVKVEIMKGENPPPGLFEQLAVVTSKAQPPSILSGVRPSGVYSAQGMEDLMTTAKPIYKDAFKNLEDGLAIVLGMGARIIEKVYKQEVAIRDLSGEKAQQTKIKPDNIKGYYECKVTLLAEPPEATDIRKTLGTNLQKAGVISHKTNLKKYNDYSDEEVLDEMAQMYAERAMQQPALLEIAAQDAAKRLGMEQVEEEARLASNMPPRRLPEQMPTGEQGVPVRGRTGPSLENIGTPQEQETSQIGMGG